MSYLEYLYKPFLLRGVPEIELSVYQSHEPHKINLPFLHGSALSLHVSKEELK